MRIRLVTTTVVAIASALVLAGCGGSDGDGSGGGASKPASGTTAKGGDDVAAELQVRMEQVGGKSGAGIPVPAAMACTKSIPATCNGTVTCPAEAKSPQPSGACEWLATKDARELLLEAPAEDEVCTQIYGGPEVATVTGTLDGEQVDATFSRENGCAVARFDAAAALWDDPQPSNGPGDDAVPPTVSEPTVSAPNAIEPDVVDDPPSAFER